VGIVLDYTARIAPAALKAAGVVGVCRYLKPDSVPAYRIGLAEYRELVAAGIDVTLNWEFDAYDWLGGAGRGQAHGEEAVRQAKALGYPAGRVIVGSADFDMTLGQWQTSAASYARAFATAVRAGGYRPGVYGPWDVLGWVKAAGVMDAFWQAGMSTAFSAGRNANAWPGAHLRQRGHRTVGGQDTDWNEILIPNWGHDMVDFTTPIPGTETPDHKTPRTEGEIVHDVGVDRAIAWNQRPVTDMPAGSPGRRLLELPDVVAAMAAREEQRDGAALAAITALATLVQQGGGNVDAASVIAAVHAVGDDAHALVVALQQQLADANAEIRTLRAELEATMSPAERASVPPAAG
jgi:hypothetical protein